jgi:hypothetical protein
LLCQTVSTCALLESDDVNMRKIIASFLKIILT